MSDIFGGISDFFSNDLGDLFSLDHIGSAALKAGASALKSSTGNSSGSSAAGILNLLNSNLSRLPTDTSVPARKTAPAEAVSPFEVEAQWTARLAKYAGIAQQTGVKV